MLQSSSMSAPRSPASPADILPSTSRDSGLNHGSDGGSAGEARISRLRARIRSSFLPAHTQPEEHSGTLDRAFSRAKVWGKRKGKRKTKADRTAPPDSAGGGALDGASKKSNSSGSGSGSCELTYSVSRSASCSSAEVRSRSRLPLRSFPSSSPADSSPVSLIAGGRRGLPWASRNSSAGADASSGEEPTRHSDSSSGYPLSSLRSRVRENTKTNARPLPFKRIPSSEQKFSYDRERVSGLDSHDPAPLPGRPVNGPAPIDLEKDAKDNTTALPSAQNQSQNWNPWQNMWQNQQMQAMGMNLGPTTPGMSQLQMNMGMFNPLMSQMNMGGMMLPHQMYNPMLHAGMGMPMGFNPVPTMPNMMMGMDPSMVGMDPSMMAAHLQAMAIAKQAYQMAIAQQAIAAAGDEWERSNNMGYNSVPGAPTMPGTPPGNAFGGGSPLGAEGQAGGSILGGSVYGDGFGPAQYQHDWRQMAAMGGRYGSSLEVENATSRAQRGKPTVTSTPSASPPAYLRGDGASPMPPPSS